MLRGLVAKLFGLATLVSVSSFSFAADFSSLSHDVYRGDLNADGIEDLYFHPKEQLILLHGDIVTPILTPPDQPAYQSLTLDTYECGSWSAEYCDPNDPTFGESTSGHHGVPSTTTIRGFSTHASGPTEIVDPELSEAQLAGLQLLVEGRDYLVGDFDGDGKNDFVINRNAEHLVFIDGQAGTSGAQNSIFGWDEATSGSAYAPSNPYSGGFAGGTHGRTFVAADFNGDGRDDIVAYGNSTLSDYYETLTLSGDSFDFSHGSDYSPKTIQLASVNGASNGSFRVNEMGAATYSIPLSLPQGTAGVAPSFSLDYSSASGDGLLGHGWSLSGQSAIARCNRTLSEDGYTTAIQWNAEDALCFDGKRLIQEGTGSASPREYRTQFNDHRIIKSHGPASNPSYFTVEAKDGSISYYGNTSESKVKGLSELTRQWAINEFQDSVGNQIVYKYYNGYVSSTGSTWSFRLTEVKYAYGNGTTPHARIKFNYEDRPDNSKALQAGVMTLVQKRLSDIQVFNRENGSETEIRKYNLHYERDSVIAGKGDRPFYNKSYIAAIQECSGSDCLPAVEFESNNAHSLEFQNAWETDTIMQRKSHLLQMLPMDIDGDGHLDMVWLESDEFDSDHTPVVRYSMFDTGTGRYTAALNFLGTEQNCGNYALNGIEFCENPNKAWERTELQAIDFNGDSRQDLAIYHDKYNKWSIYLARLTSTGVWRLPSEPDYQTADLGETPTMWMDINSDGLQDLIAGSDLYIQRRKASISEASEPNELAPAQALTKSWEVTQRSFGPSPGTTNCSGRSLDQFTYAGAGDFDGDGAAEVVLIHRRLFLRAQAAIIGSGCGVEEIRHREEHYYLAKLSDTNIVVYQYLDSAEKSGYQNHDGESANYVRYNSSIDMGALLRINSVDINADGLFDLLIETDLKSRNYQVWINDGREMRYRETLAIGGSDNTNVIVQDVTGDGYGDIVVTQKGSAQIDIYPWKPWEEEFGTLTSLVDTGAQPDDKMTTMLFDVNGDGHLDQFTFAGRKFRVRENTLSHIPNVVTSITNGLGATTYIDYERLASSPHYTSYQDTAFVGALTNVTRYNCQQTNLDPNWAPGDPDFYYYVSEEDDTGGGGYTTCEPFVEDVWVGWDRNVFFDIVTRPFSNNGAGEESFVDLSAGITVDKIPVFESLSSMPVVTRVEADAPAANPTQAGSVDHSSRSAIEYFYKHLRFQAAGRGTLGFASLKTLDMQSQVLTETKYRQDWPFVGMPYQTTQYDSGEVLTRSETSWGYHGWTNSTRDALRNSYASGGGSSVLGAFFPYIESTVETTYGFETDPNNPSQIVPANSSGPNIAQTVALNNAYDNYGNLVYTQTTTQGSDGLSLVKTTRNDYDNDYNLLSANSGPTITFASGARSLSYAQLGRLTYTSVTTQRGTQVPTTRQSSFTYNTSGSLAGLLKTETLEPNKQHVRVITEYSYDPFGNTRKSETTARNYMFNFDGLINSSEETTRHSYSPYDDAGRYTEGVYSGLRAVGSGNFRPTEIITARNEYGLPTEITSQFDDTVTTIDYDVMGREIWRGVNVADDGSGTAVNNWTRTEYLKCSTSGLNCPAGTSYAVRKTGADGSLSVSYYDKLARSTREETRNFNNSVVFVDTEYDVNGRAIRSSQPYIKNHTPRWSETDYDILGRVVETRHPDTGGATATQIFRYKGYETTFTNAKGFSRTETKNGLGQLVAVDEELNARIHYEYDNAGNLEYMRSRAWMGDALEETITTQIEYDMLGRKTKMIDPNKGTWEYKYNAFGDLVWQRDGKGQVVVNTYDYLGRLQTRTDYAAGYTPGVDEGLTTHTRWYFDGNVDGQTGAVVDNAELKVSAIVMSNDPSVEVCDATYPNGGKLLQCVYPTYDRFGRSQSTAVRNYVNGIETRFTTGTVYDDLGRVLASTDALDGQISSPDGGNRYSDNTMQSGTENHYTANGYLESVSDLFSGTAIYTLEDVNVRGQVTQARRGNNVEELYYYDAYTGRLTSQTTKTSFAYFQNYNYTWDVLGNLERRTKQDLSAGPQGQSVNAAWEHFCYDSLNRLVKTFHKAAGGQAPDTSCQSVPYSAKDQRFDSRGNILYKHDVGDYNYGENGYGPHAVTSTSAGDTYHYDANGNMTRSRGTNHRDFTYTTFDKPSRITKGLEGAYDHVTEFKYGIDRGRYWRKDTDKDGNVRTTWYLGGVEKIVDSAQPGVIKWKRYLGKTAIVTVTSSDANVISLSSYSNAYEIVYPYRDHLGSLDVILDATGTEVLQEMSFNAWGGRRDADAWTDYDLAQFFNDTPLMGALKKYTTRGYTGHEMLDEVGIIHMNGRIYDARLARMLQADPIIQAATNTQSLNRYSYVWNNPLNSTDPSGYRTKRNTQQRNVRQAVAVVVAVVATWACANASCGKAGYAAVMAAASAAGAMINGASGEGILRAAVAGAVMAYAGGMAGMDQLGQRIVVMGVAGGMSSMIQGGKFGHGFVSGAAGAATGGLFDGKSGWQVAARIGTAAVVGGTVSDATGGKFANGAATAAFAAAIQAGLGSQSDNSNDTEHKKNAHTLDGKSPHGRGSFSKEKIAEIDASLDKVRGRLVGTSPGGDSDIASHNSAVALTNDAELIGISKEYDIEVSSRLGTDGTIKSIDTIYHHSSAGNTARGNESLWHTHPGRAFKNNIIGQKEDMRSLSRGDILNNRNWKYAAYFDGSIVGMHVDSPAEWLYENGAWGKTGKLKRVY